MAGKENDPTRAGVPVRRRRTSFWMQVSTYSLPLVFVLLVITASMLSPKFFTLRNAMNLLQQSSVVGIVAVGMTLVILVAEIDLSVGSVVALGGMIAAILLSKGVGGFVATLAAVGAGVVIGAISGWLVTRARVPSFITTLAAMVAVRGLTLLLTDGKPVFNLTPSFRVLGSGFVGPVPVSGLVWLVITLAVAFALRYTPFGRSLYAMGGNYEAARLSGIPVVRTKMMVFIICSGLTAFAGVVMSSWLTVGQPTAGQGLELTAIAAVVLGGTNLFGGSGGTLNTLFGVAVMAVLTNIFNLVGLSSYYQSMAMGVIIVLAVILNTALARVRITAEKGGEG